MNHLSHLHRQNCSPKLFCLPVFFSYSSSSYLYFTVLDHVSETKSTPPAVYLDLTCYLPGVHSTVKVSNARAVDGVKNVNEIPKAFSSICVRGYRFRSTFHYVSSSRAGECFMGDRTLPLTPVPFIFVSQVRENMLKHLPYLGNKVWSP